MFILQKTLEQDSDLSLPEEKDQTDLIQNLLKFFEEGPLLGKPSLPHPNPAPALSYARAIASKRLPIDVLQIISTQNFVKSVYRFFENPDLLEHNSAMQENVVSILANLTGETDEYKEEMLSAGILPVIKEMIESHPSVSLLEKVIWLLGNLCMTNRIRDYDEDILNLGELLMDLLDSDSYAIRVDVYHCFKSIQDYDFLDFTYKTFEFGEDYLLDKIMESLKSDRENEIL